MRAYGSDRLSLGRGGRFVLACRVPKGWIARREATLTSPEHPGTAVYWEEQWFEVVGVESLDVDACTVADDEGSSEGEAGHDEDTVADDGGPSEREAGG